MSSGPVEFMQEQTGMKNIVSEVAMSVTVNGISSLDVAPCSLVKLYQHFGGKYIVSIFRVEERADKATKCLHASLWMQICLTLLS
jgi:hypothetical protein